MVHLAGSEDVWYEPCFFPEPSRGTVSLGARQPEADGDDPPACGGAEGALAPLGDRAALDEGVPAGWGGLPA